MFQTSKCVRTVCLALSILLGSGLAGAQQQDSWTVNFNNTDIRELIKFVADATGKTIIVDPKVKGKVEVISQKPLSTDELYQLFLSILKVHGYAAVENGGVLKVIDEKGARTQASSVARKQSRANGAYVTHVIQLENVAAAKLIPVLRPLVPQQAHLAAYAPSNAIIITDSGNNIRRIRAVIEQIDTAAVAQTTVIRLKHASAEEVASLIERMDKKSKVKGAADAGSSAYSLVADKRSNSVVIIGDEVQRARLRTLVRYLDVPLENVGNANVIYLEYADAVEVAEVIGRVIANISKMEADKAKDPSARTTAVIEADEATNALIVTAEADAMQTIEAVVAKLDIRRAQVLVEAILVEVSNINNNALGVEWLFADSSGVYGASTGNNGDIGLLGQTTASIIAGSELGGAAALSANPGLALGVGRIDADGLSFNVLLKALEEQSDTNILSTPSLLTLDNNEASIVVGQEVPFVTGSFSSVGDGNNNPNNPFQTIERKDVGITLRVTPRINEGDSIVMEIVQEISSLTDILIASDVITKKREITTTVLADDGDTVVLGGLIEDRLSEGERKVPLLGDIPWLGRLFRSSSTKLEKTNLMVFLRSTIIRDRKVLRGASASKYQYMRDQQLGNRAGGIDLMPDDVMPVLPEWKTQLRELNDLNTGRTR